MTDCIRYRSFGELDIFPILQMKDTIGIIKDASLDILRKSRTSSENSDLVKMPWGFKGAIMASPFDSFLYGLECMVHANANLHGIILSYQKDPEMLFMSFIAERSLSSLHVPIAYNPFCFGKKFFNFASIVEIVFVLKNII